MNLGYLAGTFIFLAALLMLVVLQIRAKQFRPLLYWATIVASTTAGTTMADFADRSLGIGYAGGSTLLFAVRARRPRTLVSLAGFDVGEHHQHAEGRGLLLGDHHLFADPWHGARRLDGRRHGLGYIGAALVFGAALALVAAAYFWTKLSHVTLFWMAFILTRPLGATVGDYLDKPVDHGGLALSRPVASLVLGIAMLALILILPQRASAHPQSSQPS